MTIRETVARSGIARSLRAAADLRRQAEIAVVERLSPPVSIESAPLVILVALLTTLIASRRH